MWIKSILFLQKLTTCCHISAILMSLQHGNTLFLNRRNHNGQITVTNWMTNWGYGNPTKNQVGFFPTPWQTPSSRFYIPLPTMGQLRWLRSWTDMHEDTPIKLWKQSTTSVGPVRSTPGKTTQLPPWMTYQYVSVSVCMFFRWPEASLSHKANVITVEERLLENMCPTWVYLPQPPVIKEPTSLGRLYNP